MNWTYKKVLVAGGAGMIGSHLSTELVKRGATVTIADNLSSGSVNNINHLLKEAEFVNCDLRERQNCIRATKGKDAIFQLSATMGGMAMISTVHADIMHDNGLLNTNMLRAALKAEVPHYFYSSSACIYPVTKQTSPDVVPLKEDDAYPAMPNESYGWEKLYSEQLALAYQQDYGMNIRIGRFHNIYGTGVTCFHAKKGKAPCHLILKAIKHPNPLFEIWGSGEATRSFCHFSDCIEMVLRLMDSDFTGPINIGSDRLVTINQLAQLVIDISGKKIVPLHVDGPVGVMGRNAELSLMRYVLKYEPRVSLEEGLKETYEWAQEHYKELEGI